MESIYVPLAYTPPFAQRSNPSEAQRSRIAAPPAQLETRVKSDAELWRILAGAIGQTQTGTVDVYHRMLTQYTAFYRDVTEFRARLRTYIGAGSDQNHIGADIGKINYELLALRHKWRNAIVFGPGRLEHAQRWSAEWSLPLSGYATQNDARVVIDTAPIEAMIEATGKVEKKPGKTDTYYVSVVPDDVSQKTDWLAAEHHAWDTAMGEQHRQIETRVNTLAEQNNHAISTFNNLIKILSASINAQSESLGSYLKALA